MISGKVWLSYVIRWPGAQFTQYRCRRMPAAEVPAYLDMYRLEGWHIEFAEARR